MGECKTKAIQTNLGTFRHNQTYPGIIQAYSSIFRTLSYPDIFKTVNQSPNIFRSRRIFRTPAFTTLLYSERWHIQNLRHIQNPVVHLR